jgi:pimeloyl-ACP methyl ester carboxylesterase
MTISYLVRPEGRIAYQEQGTGPLVVTIPGMGDLRATWRFLTPALVDAGYRVVDTDLRGHGDSDTTFTTYSNESSATDIIALLESLGEPAALVGNSMGAAISVLVAAERPELVSKLVLVGPFVRNPAANAFMLGLFRVMLAPLWAAASWTGYLPTLYAGRKPADFAEYRRRLGAAIRRPGYAKAFSLTTRTSHAGAEAVLPKVAAPTLVVMGDLDPDFSTPQTEAAWIGETLSATVVMVPDAGHYPQSQRPDVVAPAVASFLSGVN